MNGFRHMLIRRADIHRRALTSNAWNTGGPNGDDTGELQPHLSDVPCRYWTPQRTVRVTDAGGVLATLHMHVPTGTDVRIGDWVVKISKRNGAVLIERNLKVQRTSLEDGPNLLRLYLLEVT